jgi:uncharacterized protein YqeY
MLRERFSADLKDAIKARDATSVSTLRLILTKMIRQREESARTYDEGGRLDLAEKERNEIRVIRHYLPRQMSETEVRKAIDSAISETGAASIRDMGRVMATLKERHTGQMDFAKAGAAIKAALG